MRISVTGPREGQVATDRAAYTLLAVKDFARQLGIQKLRTNILVRLHDGINLSFPDAKDCEGLCEAVDTRNFIVDIATWGDWVTTLAHEMVHVKQFALGELDPAMSRWKSQSRNFDDYWSQPWEKEARRLQHQLATNFSKGMWDE